MFLSFDDVTTTGEGLQIFTNIEHSWPLSRGSSWACHTFCDTGHPCYAIYCKLLNFPIHDYIQAIWQEIMLYSGHYIMFQYLKCIFIIHFQQWPILCSIVKSVGYKVCGGEKGMYFAFFAYRKDLNCLILINACLLHSASVTRQGVNPACWPVSPSTSSSPSRLTTTASLGLMDQ